MKIQSSLLMAFLLILSCLPVQQAHADVRCGRNGREGVCGLEVGVPGSSGGSGGSQSEGSGGSGEQRCYSYDGKTEVPCRIDGGQWNPGRMCYARPADPQPPKTDPIWTGHSGGVVMSCNVAGNSPYSYWEPGPEEAQPPDPEVLAKIAVERMELRPVGMGMWPDRIEGFPGRHTLVGWRNWLWVTDPAPNTWGPIVKTASQDGYSVTATASVTRLDWDMGDGHHKMCGKGVPHPANKTRDEASPFCGYQYPKRGTYTVTATSYWTVVWSGMGQTGTIKLELSSQLEVNVIEAHVVTIPDRNSRPTTTPTRRR